MVEHVYRSTKHPRLPDAFERLQARIEEPRTTDALQTWLDHATPALSKSSYDQFRPSSLHPAPSSTRQLRSSGFTPRVNTLPLQPTHGNQPPPTRANRKRKMPNSSDTVPRQSARNKKVAQSTSADDEPSVKGKDVITRVSHRQRKVGGKKKEDYMLEVTGYIPEDDEPSGCGDSIAVGRRLVKGIGLSSDLVLNAGVSKLPRSISTPSKGSSSPSKRSGSPSKGLIIVDKRERMEFMLPPITFATLLETKKEGLMKGKLLTLWQQMDWHERKIIPSSFKMEIQAQFDTPTKTKPPISDEYFDASNDKYATDDFALIGLTIADVLSSADEYRHSGCTEAHWISIVVSPLLNLVRRLKRYQKANATLAVLDLTSVEISPSTLCPTSSDSLFKDLDKRIDAAIGLNLTIEKRKILKTGIYSEGIPSINQTASFVNFVPIFANIEVKRPNTDRDPLIQLGTWIAAEFKKRKREGYSLDMPVLAIEIEGDIWNLHMVFALDNAVDSDAFECKFVGPVEMGSTKSLLGVYQILARLCGCADWGVGEYQTWFNEQILAKYGKQASVG